jgi:TldD protein
LILSQSILDKIINTGLENGADFCEIFAENTYTSSISLKDSKPSESVVGRLNGVGIRLFYGQEIIYTYTNDLSESSLIDVARMASQAITAANKKSAQKLNPKTYDSIHTYRVVPWEISKQKKIDFLHRFDKAARLDSKITQVIADLKETHQVVQIANSEGLETTETRQYSNAIVQSIAEANGNKEIGRERIGKLVSSEFFEQVEYENMAKTASQRALQNLKADYAPAGEMPVVIDNGFGGVIFHEACGHGLETTAVAKNASVFCGLLGERVANDCVTAIDDGTIANEYGSLSIDDEGYTTQKTTLIENGILKSYIVDKMGSQQTGFERTGSGRRQNYRYAPASRMRNTFLAEGDTELEDMISDIDHGLYAKRMGGGSVTPGTGAYNFVVSEGYMIKNGKIDRPVKGASLIGTGIDTLKAISKVGKHLELAAGTCGSVSGMIPTTVGQPAILVSKLTVGGRS